MQNYLHALSRSELSLPVWGLALLWLLLLSVSHLLLRYVHALAAEKHLSIAPALVGSSLHGVAGQLAFAGAVFLAAAYLGKGSAVFFAGGQVIAAVVAVAGSLRALWAASVLSDSVATPGEARGLPRPVTSAMSAQLFAGAVLCLALGLLLPHLALLGAAFFLSATGLGYLRKSRDARHT